MIRIEVNLISILYGLTFVTVSLNVYTVYVDCELILNVL